MISSLELARLAGVSQGTVDRALHGRPGVAEATRRRVLELAERHGYRPNPVARELMGLAASTLVGAVVHPMGSQATFFTALMTAMHRRLRADGLHLVVSYAEGAAEQGELAGELLARRLRGLLLVHGDPALALPAAVPMAALVLPVPGMAALIPDEVATGRTAAAGLLAMGHRRLAMLPCTDHQVGCDRRDGFVAACRASGAAVEVVSDEAGAVAAVRSGIQAVFCNNDPSARAMQGRLREAGLAAAVAGVDGAEDIPGVSTVVYPFAGVAEAAAAVIAGRAPPPVPPGTWRPAAG